MLTKGNDVPIDVPVPKKHLMRDIPIDIQRTREEERTSTEWLVFFRITHLATYDGAPHPTYLDTWRF